MALKHESQHTRRGKERETGSTMRTETAPVELTEGTDDAQHCRLAEKP